MDYKALTNRLVCAGRIEKYYDEDSSGLYTRAATAITDLLSRAEAAETRCKMLEDANRILTKRITEVEDLAEKAEHDMKRIVNQSSYPCEYCSKRKCSSTIRKRKCFDFEWRGQKEE